jgi:shikimate dehydrogenase
MRPDDLLPFDPGALPRSTLVVDVITKPVITPLLAQAQQSGHRVHPGSHMHAGQAIEAARFFGLSV